jgi:acetyl-CoA carboxylase biotin carboxylase subunit
LIVHGKDRATALARTRQALDEIIIEGVKTNIPLHRDVILVDHTFNHHVVDIHDLEKRLLAESV